MYRTETAVSEFPLCKEGDLGNGEMREFQVEGAKIVLVKDKNQYFAVSGKCTHYGAPLAKGAYCNGRIRCPWHGACFSVRTGDIEDHPGHDSLASFQVAVKNGEVVLSATKSHLEESRRIAHMSVCERKDTENTVLIVGGGGAGVSCAETLRKEGFTGRVVIVTQESCLPYDRPKLSKALSSTAESLLIRAPEFYKEHDIEVQLNKTVVHISCDQKLVSLSDGEKLPFKYCVLCTGGRPRPLAVPGGDLDGVFLLRTPADGNRIADVATGKNLVVLGTSFIGMEVAATLAKKCASVTIVGTSAVPFQQAFGKEIGSAFLKLFEKNGVQFRLGVTIQECRSSKENKVSEVVLSDGSTLPADVCVVGIGVVPATDFLKGSGINLDERGYMTVDKHLKTNVENVYACGDVCKFPLETFDNTVANIQHWQMSLKHGHVAALNIAGKSEAVKTVPFFWCSVFGKSLRYSGYNGGYEDLLIHGSLDELQFVAYFLRSDCLVAVATMQKDPIAAEIAELLYNGCVITKQDIQNNETGNWNIQEWLTKKVLKQ